MGDRHWSQSYSEGDPDPLQLHPHNYTVEPSYPRSQVKGLEGWPVYEFSSKASVRDRVELVGLHLLN
jgi:hypothetical protein